MCEDEYVNDKKPIDQSHKAHDATVSYPTIHHPGTEMCTFLFQGGVLWDMGQMLYCEIGLLVDLLTSIKHNLFDQFNKKCVLYKIIHLTL